MKKQLSTISLLMLGLAMAAFAAPKPKPPQAPISQDKNGPLIYTVSPQGDRVPDFSYSGYMAGEQAIPNVAIRVVVPVSKEDATVRIQAALNYVASLPADKNGIRGVVLLEKGIYHVQGQLTIKASGVVLRGSGMDANGTILLGEGLDRQTLIRVLGNNDKLNTTAVSITDTYVPVNAAKIKVASTAQWKVGDNITINRPCTNEWIQKLGTEHFGGGITSLGWKPGERENNWDRTITAIDGNTISLDAPITTSIDTTYGGGSITKYTWPGRIAQVGIENLRCRSTYNSNNTKDEAHRWMAITIENTCDAWVRQVTFEHFAGSAVAVWETSKRITIEDCKSLAPVSEIGAQRRHSFWITGQQILCQRLYAENGYHDFAVGYCASTVAFVQCESHLPYSFSGGIDSWASGILFDIVNIDGNAISYKNLGQDAQGAGWNVANSVLWNCSAARVDCYAPPTANNWSFGTWAQFSGDGYWGDSNNHITPRSLYYAQLTDRLGTSVKSYMRLMDTPTEASSSPTVEQAAQMVAASYNPKLQLSEFIDLAAQQNPIATNVQGVKTIDQIGYKIQEAAPKAAPMHIANGWLVRGNSVIVGDQNREPWWMGTVRPNFLKIAKPAVTRFVPGRTGTGLTDDLEELTDNMLKQHIVALDRNYGLWYDRRRDDHERIRRMDGEVWAPFYEQAFARSGQGLAWDGLSRYDLTQYNSWYWLRLKQFANLADQKGLVMMHNNYFQHNIIEAGAHWVDNPWRTANNINNTGFPEPPPFAGDKRIFMAHLFYDETNLERRDLHRAYIRQCLNNFKDNTGVIQLTSFEFTGPTHFVKFWLQTVNEWEKETGKNEIIGLSTTKDVQDSILADPALAGIVDLIDIRYWSYRSDSSVYAPLGGQNLAPRQHARIMKVGKRSFEQVYRGVREYRQKFPEKAVIYSGDNYDTYGWAVFMAGGSLADIPAISNPQFLADASEMQVTDLPGKPADQWALAAKGKAYIVYNSSNQPVKLDLTASNSSFTVRYIDSKTGLVWKAENKIKGGNVVTIPSAQAGYNVYWISKN